MRKMMILSINYAVPVRSQLGFRLLSAEIRRNSSIILVHEDRMSARLAFLCYNEIILKPDLQRCICVHIAGYPPAQKR